MQTAHAANRHRPPCGRPVPVMMVLFMLLMSSESAFAAYGNVTQDSQVDPRVVKIDEKQYLGEKIDPRFILLDAKGGEFRFGDMLGKPLILVLSYYKCDGACPSLNRNLHETLSGVDRWSLGQDYQVLTLSFDRHDNTASIQEFMHHAGFKGGLPDGWEIATFKDPEDIKRFTGAIGYKYFWSPRDRMFLHPSAYIMLSPKGRVVRYLYGSSVGSSDIEISITKAYGEELSPSNVINFVLGACYSYNYKDGKYTINIPLFVAAGGLIFGILLIIIGVMIMKRRRVRNENKIIHA